jgi:hypothetical protein
MTSTPIITNHPVFTNQPIITTQPIIPAQPAIKTQQVTTNMEIEPERVHSVETRPAVKKVFFDSTTAELSTAEQTSTDRSSEPDLSQSMGSDESTSSDENMTLCLHRVKRSFSKKNAINTVNAVNLKIPTSVNVSIRGYELAALLDGGSATTLMRASFARSVKLKWSTVNTGKKWVGAEGGKLNVVGMCQTEVTIGCTTMKMNVYVVENIIHNLVIGTHFMLENKCIVNYMNKRGWDNSGNFFNS